MPNLLRMVETKRWLIKNVVEFEDEDCHPDTLKDLNTTQCALSFFRVENEDDVDTAILGLISNRSIQDLEYILLDEKDLVGSNYEILESAGATPYEVANRLHISVVVKSGKELVRMASIMLPFLADEDAYGMKTKGEVLEILFIAKANNLLNPETVHEDVKKKIFQD